MHHVIAPSSGIGVVQTSIHYRQRKGTRTHHRCVPRPPRYTICRFSQGTFARTRDNGREAPKPDLYAAGELRTLPVIRLRRRDQQGSRHIPSGRSASSTDAFPRKVNGFLTPFAILCARKASSESPLWLHLKSRE